MSVMLTSIPCCVIVLLSVYLQCTSAMDIEFANCGPDTLHNVNLAPCTALPCDFHKGQNVTVTIDFTTEETASAVKAQVYGIVAGIPVPFSLPNSNACNESNLSCPLPASTAEKYISAFPVLQSYPVIKLNVKWTLVDENDKEIVCFVFPMQIS